MELSNKITVITSITGGKDDLLEGQNKGNAKFVAFLDKPYLSLQWEVKPAYANFTDPRRNSRIHKLLIHKYVETEYSIWIDGNMRLLISPEEMIKKYLGDHDIAVYRHPARNCIYKEAQICANILLDDPEILKEQVRQYKENGYAEDKGLCECGMILRRHTPKIEQFNSLWWSEYCRHSRRDQVSFMYAIDRTGVRLKIIDDFFEEIETTRAIKQSRELEMIIHKNRL